MRWRMLVGAVISCALGLGCGGPGGAATEGDAAVPDATLGRAGGCAGDAPDGMVRIRGGLVRIGCDPARHDCAGFEFPYAQGLFEEVIGSFAIDPREVSWGEYAACVAAGACVEIFDGTINNAADQPAEGMNREGAEAYCRWVGKRLPSWGEWEAAARGPDDRLYPWGDAEPTCDRAHHAGCAGEGPVVVGSLASGASACGVHELAGNVAEWTADRELADGARAFYLYRGGSYARAARYLIAFVLDGDETVPYVGARSIGFRCARDD